MKYLKFVLLFLATPIFSQIRGTVTDQKGVSIPAVNIFIEGSYKNTSTNENGKYELNISSKGKYTLVFQSIGYKTKKVPLQIESFPYQYNCQLDEEVYSLSEVVINNKENPANAIIKNAIAHRKDNTEKTNKFNCDFYSKGIIRMKDVPKKIMGQDVGDLDGALDSTRTGVIYLSETVSKLKFQKPDKMNERIVASKVSGKNNGFSFNTAQSVDFDFYENNLPFQANVISPISSNAFSYYKFKLESSFLTPDNQQINKIKVIPRRDTEPVVEGYIYIVENSWAIYAVDVTLKGYRMQTPAIDKLVLKQNFSYNQSDRVWTKNTQTIDFIAGMFGFNATGTFTYVYSNFEFEPTFDKKTFKNEIVSFENEANKKDNNFWNTIRPVPLTEEETKDYIKKDSIQTLRKSQKYLDSIDRKENKLSLLDLITGYTHKNSFKKWTFRYEGLLLGTHYNTVQGWNINSGINFFKYDDEKFTYTKIGTKINYGFSENKIRLEGNFSKKFNNTNRATFNLNGGSQITQFNEKKPISDIVNDVSTLFFKNNFAKFYEKNFIKTSYSQEIVNGFSAAVSLEYAERKPLYNTSEQVYFQQDKPFTSNNPLLPFDDTIPAIQKNNIIKANIGTKITFGQQYITRPDGKYNIGNDKFPTLHFNYEKGFAASKTENNYDFLSFRAEQDVTLGNKGVFAYNAIAGKFFNTENISFVDYKHFNGNQTHIGQSDRYLNQFNLLPYYTNSTNDAFFEFHSEYDDKGFIINKIPVVRSLKANLILGIHYLAVPNRLPYREFSVGLDNLGFGKFKFFRFDYVRSYQNGFNYDGVVFGLKILNALD
ncbi:MAG: DUF5686 and carboxypeptidase regulatory-like domain-containing protein [Limnohabitans sp.]|nr:DUF5686 and carboxypeptidase regulatory-like domain-containing protein [Limnohabitans sp.]